jgi:NADPH:quinone reductase-like Zn-dependent oxidoreductase
MERQSQPTMRAAAFDHYGSLDVLSVRQVPRPVAKDHEVTVSVGAAALNIGDCFIAFAARPSQCASRRAC